MICFKSSSLFSYSLTFLITSVRLIICAIREEIITCLPSDRWYFLQMERAANSRLTFTCGMCHFPLFVLTQKLGNDKDYAVPLDIHELNIFRHLYTLKIKKISIEKDCSRSLK